jgi:hypothetical protein
MNKVARFHNENERKDHFQKHVIKNKERFPRPLKSPIEYENCANEDIQNFTFFSVSENASKTHRIGFMRVLPSSNTFAVTNNHQQPTLITYFVPVSTFIPEFIYFSHFDFRMRLAIHDFDPFQLLPIGKKFSLELLNKWSTAIDEEFRLQNPNAKMLPNIKKTLFFLKKRELMTIRSEYNITHLNILKFLKKEFLTGRFSERFDLDNFVFDIKMKIIDCNQQLLLLESESILTSAALIVFMLAYYFWIYTILLKQVSFKLSALTNNQTEKLFNAYFSVIKEAFKGNQ